HGLGRGEGGSAHAAGTGGALAGSGPVNAHGPAHGEHVASIARYAGDAHGRATGHDPALVLVRQARVGRPLRQRIAVAIGVYGVATDVGTKLAGGGGELHRVLAVQGEAGVVVDAPDAAAEPATQHAATHRVVVHAVVVVADDVLGTVAFGVAPIAVIIDGLADLGFREGQLPKAICHCR